jgi:hypothetical protein
MVKYSVLFEVRTEFLNKTYTSFVFKGLNMDFIKISDFYLKLFEYLLN